MEYTNNKELESEGKKIIDFFLIKPRLCIRKKIRG